MINAVIGLAIAEGGRTLVIGLWYPYNEYVSIRWGIFVAFKENIYCCAHKNPYLRLHEFWMRRRNGLRFSYALTIIE